MALNVEARRDVRSGSPTRLSKPLDLTALIRDGCGTYDLDFNPLVQGNEFDKDDMEFEYGERILKHVNLQVLDGDDDDSDLSPFEKMKKKMTNITADGKVMKETKKEGTGDVCPPNSHVKIHYQGYVEYKEIPFDVSYLRSKQPESFKLGERLLIPGLELGLQTMKAGEKAWFLIHHDYAYGKQGCGQRIPKAATVLFEVTLHSFSENPDLLMTNPNEPLTFEGVVERAEAHLKKGKERFIQDRDIELAIKHYKEARNLILHFHLDNDKDAVLANLLTRAYQNLCICHNKSRDYKLTCQMAQDAMNVIPSLADKNVKLKFAWGKALSKLNEFEKALEKLKEAQKMNPKCNDTAKELCVLEQKMKKYEEDLKQTAQKFFRMDNGQKKKESTVSDSFIKSMTKQLQELKLSDKVKSLNLNAGLTGDERNTVKDIATKLGLHYSENNAFGETILIRK